MRLTDDQTLAIARLRTNPDFLVLVDYLQCLVDNDTDILEQVKDRNGLSRWG